MRTIRVIPRILPSPLPTIAHANPLLPDLQATDSTQMRSSNLARDSTALFGTLQMENEPASKTDL